MPKNFLNPEQPDWASVKVLAQDVADRAMVLHWHGLSPQYQLDSLAESYRKLAAELKKMEAKHDAA
jgi:hypothetical protein